MNYFIIKWQDNELIFVKNKIKKYSEEQKGFNDIIKAKFNWKIFFKNMTKYKKTKDVSHN